MVSQLRWIKGLKDGQVIRESGQGDLHYTIEPHPIRSKPWVVVLPDGTQYKRPNIKSAKALAEADYQWRQQNDNAQEGGGPHPAARADAQLA